MDAELDLHNRQQEGKDTLELKKKVVELKLKAHSLGLTTAATRGTPYVRGRGATRARFVFKCLLFRKRVKAKQFIVTNNKFL